VHFNSESKKASVRIRYEEKQKNGPLVIRELLTSFEKMCEDYPNILALGYGVAGKAIFFDFHNNYLVDLLNRVSAWAQAENYAEIDQKAKLALSELKKALQLISK
jgi:hypothetical protein